MSNQLQVVHKDLAAQIKNPVIQNRFTEVLGKRAPQFISSLIQVGNSLGPDCDSLSIISGAMVAASLDLPINKNLGFAWLVPFRDKGQAKAQFQMGYKGYIQLALRTGQYRRMNAGPINAECVGGFDAVGERIIDFTKYDPEKSVAGYFFAFEMSNGFVKRSYWSRKDVEAHAKQYSQSYRGGYNSPWKTHFDEMATKTVIANELRQWGILSVEMQQALSIDQGIVRGMGAEEVTFPDSGPIVEASKPEPEQETIEPKSPDDGDLGPQTEVIEPEKPKKPVKKPEPKTATDSNQQLEEIVTKAGFTFAQFAAWAGGIGVVQDMDSYSSFADMKAMDCARLVNSEKQGLVTAGIKNSIGGEA